MPFRRSAVLSAYVNNKRALICPNHNVEDRGTGTYNLIDRLDFSHHERKKTLQWYAGTISDNPELVGRELLAPNGSTVTTGCGPTQNYRGAVSRCTYAHTKAPTAALSQRGAFKAETIPSKMQYPPFPPSQYNANLTVNALLHNFLSLVPQHASIESQKSGDKNQTQRLDRIGREWTIQCGCRNKNDTINSARHISSLTSSSKTACLLWLLRRRLNEDNAFDSNFAIVFVFHFLWSSSCSSVNLCIFNSNGGLSVL